MTLDATANPSHARLAANPALTAALAIAVDRGGDAGGRLVLPARAGYPCPVRSASSSATPIIWRCRSALLVAFAAARGAPRGVLLAGLAILVLAALGNAWLGAYHAGVEWRFWQGPTDCTGPVVNLGSAGSLLERLDTVKVIRCDEVQWRFLGLSLAGYNVLISLLMAAIAAWGFVAARRAKR